MSARRTGAKQTPDVGRRWMNAALMAYLAVAVGSLVVLRASVDSLEFLGAGWLIVLAVLPVAPLLLDRVGDLAKTLSPHVSSLKIGALQFDLRDARRDPITLTAAGVLASVPNDMHPFQSTGLDTLTRDLAQLHRRGQVPAVVIDLRDGMKWRRSNLYLFARLLDAERETQLVFTEVRGDRDGYIVGTGRPADVVRQLERTLPEYAAAAGSLAQPLPPLPGTHALTEAGQQVARLSPLLQPNDNVYLGTAEVAELLGPLLSDLAIELTTETLSERDLRAIVGSRFRFVPATSDGRIFDLIDRDSVALVVARAALNDSPAT
ncbi:MAG: hypothetical protein AB7L13_08225 [Acidimicrobiia bacterium]